MWIIFRIDWDDDSREAIRRTLLGYVPPSVNVQLVTDRLLQTTPRYDGWAPGGEQCTYPKFEAVNVDELKP